MALEFAPPKYGQLVYALQQRIESGEFAPGSLLPSEHQLSREYQVSRPTVVRALQILRQQGWIDPQQGKGTFVKGRPSSTEDRRQRGREVLERDEATVSGRLVHAGLAPAPERIAAQLGVESGSEVLLRRRVVTEGRTPTELTSAWFPAEFAAGTALDSPEPLPEGIRRHVQTRKGVRIDRVVERITARMPTEDETALLKLAKRTPVSVLSLVITAYDPDGRPVEVVEVVLPSDRHELEDTYPLT